MATEIVAMRRVSAYRTTDGELHDNRPAATRHQAKLDLMAWVASNIPPGDSEAELATFIVAMTQSAEGLTQLLRAANKEG